MKLYAFTDIHGDLSAAERVAENVSKLQPDFMVSCGDFVNFGQSLNKVMNKLDLGIPMLMIHGNHESKEQLDVFVGKNRINLHKATMDFKDYIFLGYGGGGFNQEDEEFTSFVSRTDKASKGKKMILVTHMPPFKTRLDKLSIGYRGLIPLREFILERKPVLTLSGHLHENSGKVDFIGNTALINPGPTGQLIEI